ncbi:MAG: hypothetical protein IJV66_06345 [Firmicutes bacterium]|nr:hypothetical protein [Bacillota bacterium]
MSDEKTNINDILTELESLGSIADELESFRDPFEDSIEAFNGDLPDDFMAGGITRMPGIFPGSGGISMPGAPKEIGLFDTVIVHGFRSDYKLTFEETDEGLVISVAQE